jgi:hypothetical protein
MQQGLSADWGDEKTVFQSFLNQGKIDCLAKAQG